MKRPLAAVCVTVTLVYRDVPAASIRLVYLSPRSLQLRTPHPGWHRPQQISLAPLTLHLEVSPNIPYRN